MEVKGVRSDGAEVTGDCELPNKGAGTQTHVVYKSRV